MCGEVDHDEVEITFNEIGEIKILEKRDKKMVRKPFNDEVIQIISKPENRSKQYYSHLEMDMSFNRDIDCCFFIDYDQHKRDEE